MKYADIARRVEIAIQALVSARTEWQIRRASRMLSLLQAEEIEWMATNLQEVIPGEL